MSSEVAFHVCWGSLYKVDPPHWHILWLSEKTRAGAQLSAITGGTVPGVGGLEHLGKWAKESWSCSKTRGLSNKIVFKERRTWRKRELGMREGRIWSPEPRVPCSEWRVPPSSLSGPRFPHEDWYPRTLTLLSYKLISFTGGRRNRLHFGSRYCTQCLKCSFVLEAAKSNRVTQSQTEFFLFLDVWPTSTDQVTSALVSRTQW